MSKPTGVIHAQSYGIVEEFKSSPKLKGYGFIEMIPVIMSVITGLTQLFQDCRKKEEDTDPPEVAMSKYITNRYNASTDEYADVIFAKTMAKLRRECRKKGQRPTRSELREMAKITLDKARNASQEVLAEVAQEAFTSEYDPNELDLD